MLNLILKELKDSPYKLICGVIVYGIYGGLVYMGSEGKPLNGFKEFINKLKD